jgi:hypothetical protein
VTVMAHNAMLFYRKRDSGEINRSGSGILYNYTMNIVMHCNGYNYTPYFSSEENPTALHDWIYELYAQRGWFVFQQLCHAAAGLHPRPNTAGNTDAVLPVRPRRLIAMPPAYYSTGLVCFLRIFSALGD